MLCRPSPGGPDLKQEPDPTEMRLPMLGRRAGRGPRGTLARPVLESGTASWLSNLPSRWGLVAVGVATALAALVTIHTSADPDLFARVAVGRLIEVKGGVTDQDPFAFTPLLDRWIDHEWLSGVIFYRVARLGGDWGLLVTDLVLMLGMVTILIRAQHEFRGASLGWSLMTMVLLFGGWISVVRSRAFTLLFVPLLLLALVRWRKGRPGWLLTLPPAFLIWANVHGGFVAGLGLLGTAALSVTLLTPKKALPLWLCLVVSVFATLVNPYGLDYWVYILRATTQERPLILEWQTMQGWQIGSVVVLGAIFLAGAWLERTQRRVLPETVGLLAVSLWAALESQRLLNFVLMVLAVYGVTEYRAVVRFFAARISENYRRATAHLSGVFAMALPVTLMVVIGMNLRSFSSTGLSYEKFPVAAVEWLHRHGAGGRLLTHFNHGSFAIWRLYPLYRVALDGRYEETYPEETVQLAWLALQPNAPGHEDALRRIDPDYIIVPGPAWAEDFPGDWQTVFSDSTSVVLARPGLPTVDGRPERSMWTPGF